MLDIYLRKFEIIFEYAIDIFNMPYFGFLNYDLGISLFDNAILNGFFYLILAYLFNLLLIIIGRFKYDTQKNKRKIYGNIYFWAFVLRFFPIISLIASFLLGMNNEKLSKIIKIFTAGFILYTIIGYLVFKYFKITWMNIIF